MDSELLGDTAGTWPARAGVGDAARFRLGGIGIPAVDRSQFSARALAVFVAFSALTPTILSSDLHQPCHAVAGAVVFPMFAMAAAVLVCSITPAAPCILSTLGLRKSQPNRDTQGAWDET
jgi:hypothetical protein